MTKSEKKSLTGKEQMTLVQEAVGTEFQTFQIDGEIISVYSEILEFAKVVAPTMMSPLLTKSEMKKRVNP